MDTDLDDGDKVYPVERVIDDRPAPKKYLSDEKDAGHQNTMKPASRERMASVLQKWHVKHHGRRS